MPNENDTGHRQRAIRRIGLAFCAGLAVLAVVGLFWAAPKMTTEPTITLTQMDLQQKAAEKLPFTFTTKRKLTTPITVTVTVSKVNIEVRDDVIYLDIDASATKAGKDFSLNAKTIGRPRYDETTGKFYFAPEELTLGNFLVNNERPGAKTTRMLDALAKVPMLGAKTEEWRAQAKELVNEHVQEAVQNYLETHPVYALPSGSFKRAALKNFEVKNNTVLIKISLWQVTLWVLGWVAIGVLAILLAIVIILNPELLLVFMPLSFIGN